MTSHSRFLAHIPIRSLSGLGPALERKFNQINIYTVADLLLHFPMRYEDRSKISSMAQLQLNESTTVIGKIIKTEQINARKNMLLCTIDDGTGIIQLRFMNFYPQLVNTLKPEFWVKAYGEVIKGSLYFEMIHPDIQTAFSKLKLETSLPEHYHPIYGTTQGLSQTSIRKFVSQALALLKNNEPTEILPDSALKSLPSLLNALLIMHTPPLGTNLTELERRTDSASKRLIIEELTAHHLNQLIAKRYTQTLNASAMQATHHLVKPFLDGLPFTPTNAQTRVAKEIWADMEKSIPMMRLVQGDVGSGKTLVAALAALRAIENGKQVAFLAPTEILAEQHFNNFNQWLTPLRINCDILLGKLTAKQKKLAYENLKSGETTLIIGTHAVLVDQVEFLNLGLIIIDEQHRFGVNQRLSLHEKNGDKRYPHQLMMTATPIPRTLLMTMNSYLDVSVIDELPPGRTPIKTAVIADTRRDEILERVYFACKNNQQVYWVYTLIDESEILDANAAQMAFEEISQCYPDIKVGLIHGRMKATEKKSVMESFKQGEIQLLIATTVIEVGVDVPNANLMIIENAERLGLAQLHQLRGRVGRGHKESHCVLIYKSPLSHTTRERLNTMRTTTDGFIIAQKDFELRGGGDMFGTRQVGEIEFKIADLFRDQYLIEQSTQVARELLNTNPSNAGILIDSWLENSIKYLNA